MKKFYTVFLLALVGIVCSFGASAQDDLPKVKLTLNVDRDNAVEYKVSYNGIPSPKVTMKLKSPDIIVGAVCSSIRYTSGRWAASSWRESPALMMPMCRL